MHQLQSLYALLFALLTALLAALVALCWSAAPSVALPLSLVLGGAAWAGLECVGSVARRALAPAPRVAVNRRRAR